EPYPEQGPGTAGRVFGAPRPGEPADEDPRAPSLPHPCLLTRGSASRASSAGGEKPLVAIIATSARSRRPAPA
ncbi:hypothetical protein, partial [Streptomyces eurythermus]